MADELIVAIFPSRKMLTKALDHLVEIKDLNIQHAAIVAKANNGEVVVLNEDGTTSFADLQAAFQEGANQPLTYFAFDLLHLSGHNLRGLPLVDRKAILEPLVKDVDGVLRYSEHLESDGEVIFRKACELQAEGIVSKRADSPYRSGPSKDWLKVKCTQWREANQWRGEFFDKRKR